MTGAHTREGKVCIVSIGLPQQGGAELRAFRHTCYLREERGIECILIARDRSGDAPPPDVLPSYVHRVGMCFQDVRDKRPVVTYIKLILHLAELGGRLACLLLALREEFDILHVIFAASWFTLIPIPLAKVLGKRVIVEMVAMHTDDPLTLKRRSGHPEQQIFRHRPLKYRLFLQADAYVSKSHALSEAYRQAGLPESKLFQIHSGVDAREFSPPTREQKAVLRRKFRLNDEDTVILFVGRIDERKGVCQLLAAFRELVAHHSQIKLLIVGPAIKRSPTLPNVLQDQAVAWGLSSYVDIVGPASHVSDYLKASDIFALPTGQEGFSMAIIEAMSSGLAIVTSDIPEIALSQIQHGVEGLLVPAGNTSQLTRALGKLISDPGLRASLGEAARRRVLREFTADVIGDQYVQLYTSLVQSKTTVI